MKMAKTKNIQLQTISLNLSVPSEIFLTLRETENQFISNMKKFTALFLFQNQKLSIGQGAELANMNEEDFIYFLGENKISIFEYLDESTLREELADV
jgi:predicted HTH domain antitoxin